MAVTTMNELLWRINIAPKRLWKIAATEDTKKRLKIRWKTSSNALLNTHNSLIV